VVTYAPTAATKPSIAAQPLKRSASGVMIKKVYLCIIVTVFMKLCKVFFLFLIFFEIFLKKKQKKAKMIHKCVNAVYLNNFFKDFIEVILI
jgi:hypothetical protein